MISTPDEFRTYLSAFNASDFDLFSSFYSDDIVIVLNPQKTINGRQAAAEFFKQQRQLVDEELAIHHLIIDKTGVAIRATAEFTARKDLPEVQAICIIYSSRD